MGSAPDTYQPKAESGDRHDERAKYPEHSAKRAIGATELGFFNESLHLLDKGFSHARGPDNQCPAAVATPAHDRISRSLSDGIHP